MYYQFSSFVFRNLELLLAKVSTTSGKNLKGDQDYKSLEKYIINFMDDEQKKLQLQVYHHVCVTASGNPYR